ncbi:MAG: NAD-dependent epimerase/dehydratase family protein [Candidatus Sumerlaeia bacterium]
MRVIVTGGAGRVGKALVDRLSRNGHEVRVIGRRKNLEFENAEYLSCNITDYDELREMIHGMQAIVHLAAIPGPEYHTGDVIFETNCRGTFNVYQAAAEEGIDRICCTSSINFLGITFGKRPMPVRYFPVDEDHPGFTTDAYSFSKHIMEDIAAYFWRRERISSTCIRLPGVYQQGSQKLEDLYDEVRKARDGIAELMEMPQAERVLEVRKMVNVNSEAKQKYFRTNRHHNLPPEIRQLYRSRKFAPVWRAYGVSDFWAGISDTDAARAMEQAITLEYTGCHPIFVNDSINNLGVDANLLADLFFPEIHARKRELVGKESLVSIERARNLLGFEPEFHLGLEVDNKTDI